MHTLFQNSRSVVAIAVLLCFCNSNCFSKQVGISKLKQKVVMLLVSKPDVLPTNQILLLLKQTHEHPHHKNINQDYEIVWVPITSSETWTLDEHVSFDYLSNSLPWLSVRKPWLLNSTVVRMIREEWKFEENPLMVVLDPQGSVSNYNALDMVLIWGAKAFPFSDSREKELWEEEHWNMDLLLNGVDSFQTTMVRFLKLVTTVYQDKQYIRIRWTSCKLGLIYTWIKYFLVF